MRDCNRGVANQGRIYCKLKTWSKYSIYIADLGDRYVPIDKGIEFDRIEGQRED